jgi:hypothetical protein
MSARRSLHPDDREETIAGGFALAGAEDLCASMIAALHPAPPTPSAGGNLQPRPPRRIKKHGGRQLLFKF